jgi:hypothetical protein
MQDTLNVNDLLLYLPHLLCTCLLCYIIPVNILCIGTIYLNLLRSIIYVDTCLNCTAEITLNKRSILKKTWDLSNKFATLHNVQSWHWYRSSVSIILRVDVTYGFTLQFSIFGILFYHLKMRHSIILLKLAWFIADILYFLLACFCEVSIKKGFLLIGYLSIKFHH